MARVPHDPQALLDAPRYTLPEASHYLHIARATLRSWVVGRSYPTARGTRQFQPLILRPDRDDPRLSYSNLVEAFVLRSLRTGHEVPLHKVRSAIDYAQAHCGVKRLLLSPDLRTTAGEVFMEEYGKLLMVSQAGQRTMREVFLAYLKRITWSEEGHPETMFPIARTNGESGPQIVAITTRIAFARPIILRRGVKTSTIAERFNLGEEIPEIAADYDLEAGEVAEAIRYERAA